MPFVFPAGLPGSFAWPQKWVRPGQTKNHRPHARSDPGEARPFSVKGSKRKMSTVLNNPPGSSGGSDPPPAAAAERSIGELFADLARETSTLVRQEVQLAKTELTQKATFLAKNAVFIAIGGLVAYAGFVVLLVGLAFLLNQIGLPLWLAALLVGLVVAGVGGFMALKGLKGLKEADPVPHQTVETVKEDVRWAKEQTH
jgi:hypothetical protein